MAAAQQSINDIPMGNYEDINNFMLKFSNAAAEQMRVNNTLLRNGQMKPSEYTPFRQNVMDAAVTYKKIAENYNSMMDEFTLRQQENKAGGLEAWQAGIVQDMADLSNTIPVIDPVTGNVFNAPIGADGKPDMKKAMAVRDMLNMAYQKYDIFDIDAQLNPIVEKYGKEIRVLRQKGVLTRSDILQRKFGTSQKTMDQVIDDTIKQYNPEQLASVLIDFNQGYEITDDPSVRDSDPERYILVGKDGRLANRLSPDLTDDQQAKARQLIKEQLLTKLDLVETPAPTTSGTTATERKAAEERKGSVKKAIADVNNLRKIFEAKTPEDVSQVLAEYSNQLIDLIPKTERTGSEFIRAEAVGTGDNRAINVVFRDKYGTIKSRSAGVEIPDNFQDFVDSGGVLITGNNNLRTLRKEAMAEISDPSSLVRGDAGGVYEIKVLEERLPAIDTDVSMSDAMDAVESQLDSYSYFTIGNAYSDMSTAADDMFKEMDFEDYNITKNGDVLTISIPEYGSLDFNMTLSAHGDDHDNRRGAFKKYMQNIYTALTTGKPLEGTPDPAENEEKKLRASLKALGMTDEEIEQVINAD